MGITLSSQATVFLFSVVLGSILSLIFDVIRIVNAVSKNNQKRIFFEDVFYFILSAVITFMYMLVVNMGEIRFYIIAGEVLGWIVYRVTIGTFVYKFVLKIVKFIIKWILKIKRYIVSKIPKKKIKELENKFSVIQLRLRKKIQFKKKPKKSKQSSNRSNVKSKHRTKSKASTVQDAKRKQKTKSRINIRLNKNTY